MLRGKLETTNGPKPANNRFRRVPGCWQAWFVFGIPCCGPFLQLRRTGQFMGAISPQNPNEP